MIETVGIDLGTTNSVVSYIDNFGVPKCIEFLGGGNMFPSVLCYCDKELYVGKSAIEMSNDEFSDYCKSTKRHMGTRDVFKLGSDNLYAEDCAQIILKNLYGEIKNYFGYEIKKAVITVPAYFNNQQRNLTLQAGSKAGFEVLRIINEPTAAALAYGFNNLTNEVLLVFDLGGGTFDVSILKVTTDGVYEVISTCGNTTLGGDDFDYEIEEIILNKTNLKRKQLTKDSSKRLKFIAENVKKTLNTVESTKIIFPFATEENLTVACEITKKEFINATNHLIEKCMNIVDKAIKDAKIKPSLIDKIIFVGGSTRLLILKDIVYDKFNKNPYISINPDEAIAIGAAIQANAIHKKETNIYLLDVTPLSMGVELSNGMFSSLIYRNSSIPTEVCHSFTTDTDNQTSVCIKVYQGERIMAQDNCFIGQLELTNIQEMPAGVPDISITFKLDLNGVLEVHAHETISDTKAEIVFKNDVNIDLAQKLLEDAEANEELDKQILKQQMLLEDAKQLMQHCKFLLQINDKIIDEIIIDNITDILNNLSIMVENRRYDLLEISIKEFHFNLSEIAKVLNVE